MIAHGGALIISRIHPDQFSDFIQFTATITLPISGVILVSSSSAFINSKLSKYCLMIHSIAYFLIWSVSLIYGEIPEGNFSWTPGFLAMLFAYSVYLIRRIWLPHMIEKSSIIRYLHVAVYFLILPIDISVFIKFISLFLSGKFFCN